MARSQDAAEWRNAHGGEAWAGAAGDRTGVPSTALTAQETQIIGLARDDLTDPETGAQLFLLGPDGQGLYRVPRLPRDARHGTSPHSRIIQVRPVRG